MEQFCDEVSLQCVYVCMYVCMYSVQLELSCDQVSLQREYIHLHVSLCVLCMVCKWGCPFRLCVCMSVHTHAHTQTKGHTDRFPCNVKIYICMSLYMCVMHGVQMGLPFPFVCVHVCVPFRLFVCVCVRVYVPFSFVCMCLCVYMPFSCAPR